MIVLRFTLFTLLLSLASVGSGATSSSTTHSTHRRGRNHNISPGTNSNHFELDQSELARQNQITQQIFANFLERRLFPHRNVSQKIPTIEDILPKPKPLHPRPRGFAANIDSFKSGGGAQRNRLAAVAASKRLTSSNSRLVTYEDEEEDLADQQSQANSNPHDEYDDDVQESLQSVESEQHDQYYGNIFQRDPSENEIDSGKC
ncbi:PREDICTED: uncharacterized protein LOC108612272 [Drosophila arizonae]|uniref:Uncharacterized protein LOC108612272 n=1 Tax=Drosophila arizonae TaxID=7263 RepID=A0ABM1P0A1_DROAR|nr:PREDICTED: uncharacterized protein LOC108612272 [Drosophila arizonae]